MDKCEVVQVPNIINNQTDEDKLQVHEYVDSNEDSFDEDMTENYKDIELNDLTKKATVESTKSATLRSNRKAETLKRSTVERKKSPQKLTKYQQVRAHLPRLKDQIIKFIALLHLEFFKSRNGVLKIIELVLAFLCYRGALSNFHTWGTKMTTIADIYLSISGGALGTIVILLVCYMLSARTYYLIRKSLFVSKRDNF